jgi:hypothetical protein
MSAKNQEAHSSSNVLPFRDGALGPAEIRDMCPQFRILVIGKANAGKTTILRKVCNATPDAKPIISDAEGKEIIQEISQEPAKVCLESSHKLKQNLGPYDSHRRSRRSSFFDGGRGVREMYSTLLLMPSTPLMTSSTLLLRLSEQKTVYNCH